MFNSCNCTKSGCLKLYCECFSNGRGCSDTCKCVNCLNKEEFKELKDKVVQQTLQKNPLAFKSKYDEIKEVGNEKVHNRGCNCKKTGCTKNYCECFNAGIPCTALCQCSDCHNGDKNHIHEEEIIKYKKKVSRRRRKSWTNTAEIIQSYFHKE